MQAARFFLAFVGLCYLTLGVWCSAAPSHTSNSVGFDLQKGSGQSEFFTVYGGVELAWGLIFLMPLLWSEFTRPLLIACVLIHGLSVVFRAISFLLFSGMGTTTYVLAGVEWAIFLASAGLLLMSSTTGKTSEI
ncbi:DUF4345 family protein [Blastopirellula marina]|nr:DUF4345 family protein [Blastopirellula marina]